jgi:multidrug efflux pump subunit AcrA (membrane-fusion protein)
VEKENVVRLRAVKLGRDYGDTVEVLAGLEGGEALVLNPPDDLADKELVAVVRDDAAPATPAASPTKAPR